MPIDVTMLTDEELICSLKKLVRDERANLVFILKHLIEMDRRRLAGKLGYPSLFDYCVKELRLAEGETARRIQAARTAARFHVIFGAIDRGLLTLTAISLLAPHLTWSNYRKLLRSSFKRKTREVEALVATLTPKPDRPDRVKFLGTPAAVPDASPPAVETTTPTAAADAPRETAPFLLPPQRVFFSFTADERLLAAVERAKELLQNKYGKPEFEHVFFEAVGALLEKIDPDVRVVKGRTPRAATPVDGERARSVPSWVKRAVWRRDGGRCAFRSPVSRRCGSRSGLQYDHVLPWARGGRSDDPANIRLLCRTHNVLEARRELGDGVVDAALARRRAL